ncbi:MAG TPA: Rv2578c family radical SAM protein [Thermoleophilia bacterium]|nr:Rv2578c family radical SAM protein [Thermoleophilia bacterium]
MRWAGQLVGKGAPPQEADPQLALFGAEAVVQRTFDTPEFRGVTFFEVQAKSVLNRVPGDFPMFGWTVNPYRGCTHACVYCFARRSHTYLDLDAGHDFDSKIVVKVNAPDVLRRELARPSWTREHVAMGTNVDTYQRAEGRYKLMPGIIDALASADTPFSILTKGTLILRDLDLLKRAAERVQVGLSISIGFVDESLWRAVEPGTPSPRRRLEAVRALAESGLGCGVLMAPILPYLTDSPEQLRSTVEAIVHAGARSVSPIVLHLRPGSREWFVAWLAERYPELRGRYRALYGKGSYAAKWYQEEITRQVRAYAEEFGLGPPKPPRRLPAPESETEPGPAKPGGDAADQGGRADQGDDDGPDHGEQLALM